MLEGRGLGCSHGTRSARYARRLSPQHASAIAGQRRRTRESWRQRQGRRLWESVKAEQAYISYASVLARGGRRTRGGRDCAVRMRLCGSARWRRCSTSSSRRAAAPSGPSSARGRIPVGEDCLWDNADAGQDGIPRPRGRSRTYCLAQLGDGPMSASRRASALPHRDRRRLARRAPRRRRAHDAARPENSAPHFEGLAMSSTGRPPPRELGYARCAATSPFTPWTRPWLRAPVEWERPAPARSGIGRRV